MNQHAKYLDHVFQKLLSGHTHAHAANRLLYLDH